MTIPLAIPLDVPVDGFEPSGHALGFLEPLVGFGVFVLIAAIALIAFLFLRRKGVIPALSLPSWPSRASAPEQAAKQLLAERFARGDISSEDFLERASVLNWTPGGEDYTRRRVGRG